MALRILILLVLTFLFSCQSTSTKQQNLAWKWQKHTGKNVAFVLKEHSQSVIVAAGEYPEFGSPNHLLIAYNQQNGTQLWQKNLGKDTINERFYVCKDFIYVKPLGSKPRFIDPLTGENLRPYRKFFRRLAQALQQEAKTKKKVVQKGGFLQQFVGNAKVPESVSSWKLPEKGEISSFSFYHDKICYISQSVRVICRNWSDGKLYVQIPVKKIPRVKEEDAINFNYLIGNQLLYIGEYDGTVSTYLLP